MKCTCDEEMKFVDCFDNNQEDPGYAYNLFACQDCGRICRVSVWTNPGEVWIELDGSTEHRFSTAEKSCNPHDLPIFRGVPIIKTDEAPLVNEEGMPVEYSIRTTERGDEILVHPSKWEQFCEAAEMAGELLKGRNN